MLRGEISKMNLELRKLSINDGIDVYQMLQEIPKEENGITNAVNGKTGEEFNQWLIHNDNASKGKALEEWMVPTNYYWLFAEGKPVGFGKLHHYLTSELREAGGHIVYAIRPSERNKGYGTNLLRMMIEEANKMSIDKVLLTVRNSNSHSIKVALKNRGRVEKTDEEKHFIWIDC